MESALRGPADHVVVGAGPEPRGKYLFSHLRTPLIHVFFALRLSLLMNPLYQMPQTSVPDSKGL